MSGSPSDSRGGRGRGRGVSGSGIGWDVSVEGSTGAVEMNAGFNKFGVFLGTLVLFDHLSTLF